jgi:NitT/TauT family transport system substrate-binding protein
MTRNRKHRRPGRLAVAALFVVGSAPLFGGAAQTSQSAPLETITVNTLPIANALPMDLGIQKGFFSAQGIEINKRLLQSGNDIVLALANNSGDVGYIGYVPAMIASTTGIPVTLVAASEVEGTNETDNWQNILVRGSSSIRNPADLSGKTVAVNALKGVGEVVIKAALEKSGVNPDSVKLVAIPFPNMRAALNNGQVDAIWTPEPFLSQVLGEGGRSVMAPGPILGRFFPNGGYVARVDWTEKNAALARKFRTAINQSLMYAAAHPDEVRALLPAATRNIRLAFWSPIIDRDQLRTLARYAVKYDVISKMPNFLEFVPSYIATGGTLQGTVGPGKRINLRRSGETAVTLKADQYTIVVSDRSKTESFHLKGPKVNLKTGVGQVARITWTVNLRRGTYVYSSDGTKKLRKVLKVT